MTVKVGSLRWNDPDRFNGYGLSPRSADTPAGHSVSARSIVVKRLGWWIIDVAVGSFAIGTGQRSVQPCPLHPDRDRVQRRIRMM
jgi:hypothetical protein